MMQLVGFLASFYILGAYFWSEHSHNTRPFTWANIIGAAVLLPVNLYYGAYFGAFLTVSFACIAAYGLWKHHT